MADPLIEFDTRAARSFHGSTPEGRGIWAFAFWDGKHRRMTRGGESEIDVFLPPPGVLEYEAAKTWAIDEARRVGAVRVEVLP